MVIKVWLFQTKHFYMSMVMNSRKYQINVKIRLLHAMGGKWPATAIAALVGCWKIVRQCVTNVKCTIWSALTKIHRALLEKSSVSVKPTRLKWTNTVLKVAAYVKYQERSKLIGSAVKKHVVVRDHVINVVIKDDVAAEQQEKKVISSKLILVKQTIKFNGSKADTAA